MHRAGKLGLGTAHLAGMRYAMEHGYDLLLTMDADFSHHPRYLPALLAGMPRRDVMIGSRYGPGGGAGKGAGRRKMNSWAVHVLGPGVVRLPAAERGR